jgi:periplasmic protein TonB
MFAIRAPFALVAGTLISVTLFLALSQLVSVPFDARPAAIVSYDFTPQIRETPVENKRDPKVERPPPPEVVIVDGPGWRVTDVTTVVGFDRPRVVIDGPVTGGVPLGTDRDVLPLVRVNPDFPQRALGPGIEGWVQVQFSVTATGSVRDPVVVASEPGSIFDDAALKAIARWRYNPRVVNGMAVERVGLQTVIRFELEK